MGSAEFGSNEFGGGEFGPAYMQPSAGSDATQEPPTITLGTSIPSRSGQFAVHEQRAISPQRASEGAQSSDGFDGFGRSEGFNGSDGFNRSDGSDTTILPIAGRRLQAAPPMVHVASPGTDAAKSAESGMRTDGVMRREQLAPDWTASPLRLFGAVIMALAVLGGAAASLYYIAEWINPV